MSNIISWTYWPLAHFFGEMSIQALCPFLKGTVWILLLLNSPGLLHEDNKILAFILKKKKPARWFSGKESTCQARDTGSIPRLGRSSRNEMATHSSILA